MSKDLKALISTYCKASNALTDYRRANGFEPGAKVLCRFMKNPPVNGEIAPYGDAWNRCMSAFNVVVLREDGVFQPWSMDDLTIISPAPTDPRDAGR